MGILIGKSYDLNAAEFFNATQVLTPIQKQAVNELVVDLKGYGIWTKMKAVYPMVGQAGVSSSFSYNLKDINAFRGTFSGSWVFSSTGATPDGTSSYMDTALNPSSVLTFNSTSTSYYSRSNTATGQKTELGCVNDTVDYLPILTLELKRTDSVTGVDTFVNCVYSYNSDGVIKVSNTDSRGFYFSSRVNSNTLKAYKNNSLLGINSNTQTQPSYPNTTIFIGALNTVGIPVSQFSDRECAFASIGDGLTDTEASNYYTAVQRFQTTLGRQV